MTYYAIMDRATGYFLPVEKCATRAEFVKSRPPRLFNRKSDAVNALACWREGIWRHNYDLYGESDGPQPADAPYNETIKNRRKAMDIAIVPVSISVRTL